jgi:hypothetical protein
MMHAVVLFLNLEEAFAEVSLVSQRYNQLRANLPRDELDIQLLLAAFSAAASTHIIIGSCQPQR